MGEASISTEPYITRAELARQLGVSRTYITLLSQGKRKPSQHLANKLGDIMLTAKIPDELMGMVGKGGLEPPCPEAHDPKSCSSTSSDTSRGYGTALLLSTSDLQELLMQFIFSRRHGLSSNTIGYKSCLTPLVDNYQLTPESITRFLANLKCSPGAKFSYFRAIRAFVNWLLRNDYLKESPIKRVDPPKPKIRVLPSLINDQIGYLIGFVSSTRDKAIISLLADSGIRLSEVASIRADDIDWDNHTVIIWGKGGRQRKAPFTERSAKYLLEVVGSDGTGDNIWQMKRRGIQNMLLELAKKTGLPCNPHTFRRTFASNLHRAGMDIEHIMRLGGWESLDMVVRYTRSVKFEESLKLYRELEG